MPLSSGAAQAILRQIRAERCDAAAACLMLRLLSVDIVGAQRRNRWFRLFAPSFNEWRINMVKCGQRVAIGSIGLVVAAVLATGCNGIAILEALEGESQPPGLPPTSGT